jgi:hypothetical protein
VADGELELIAMPPRRCSPDAKLAQCAAPAPHRWVVSAQVLAELAERWSRSAVYGRTVSVPNVSLLTTVRI